MKKLSILFAGFAMAANAATVTPNLYDCKGQGVKVSFSTSSFEGKPHFNITQNGQTHNFRGEELRATKSVLGTLVTVNLGYTPDLKTDSASLVVPNINLEGNELDFGSMLILTTTRTSIAGPALVRGVINPSSYIPVSCKARHVFF